MRRTEALRRRKDGADGNHDRDDRREKNEVRPERNAQPASGDEEARRGAPLASSLREDQHQRACGQQAAESDRRRVVRDAGDREDHVRDQPDEAVGEDDAGVEAGALKKKSAGAEEKEARESGEDPVRADSLQDGERAKEGAGEREAAEEEGGPAVDPLNGGGRGGGAGFLPFGLELSPKAFLPEVGEGK